MDNKKDKRKKILKISGLIGLFLLVFGLSYALFTVTLNGTKKVKIKTGKLELQLLDSNNNPIYITDQNSTSSYEINLDNQVPVSDEVGLGTQAFEFKLKNTGSVDASYTIYLDDVALESGEERLDDEYIRYSLTKNGSNENPQDLTSRELDTGVINANNTINEYTLKIWIDEAATNEAMDKVFNATLRVEGVQYVAPPAPNYGTKIAEAQISENITAAYYQPEDTGYNNSNKIKRMSNVKKIDNEETYEGGTLVISGTGEITEDIKLFLGNVSTIDDFENLYDVDAEIFRLKYYPYNLVIEEGITSITGGSFEGLYFITNVNFPSTLERIEGCTFDGTGLTNLVIPNGVTFIGADAFSGTKLTEIYLPSSVETMLGAAFYELEVDQTTVFCETQDVANLLHIGIQNNCQFSSDNSINIVVDPTKFE